MQRFNIGSSFFALAVSFGLFACSTDSTFNHNSKAEFYEQKAAVASPVPFTPTRSSSTETQDFFHMEEKILKPVEIPSEVLRLLESGKTSIADACKLNGRIINECYEGGKADLNGNDLPDFVIIGRGKMSGANITPFWIFLAAESGSRLVLETAAHDLVIGTKETNGLFDISTASITAVEVISRQFSFNGKEYELIETIREPIQ